MLKFNSPFVMAALTAFGIVACNPESQTDGSDEVAAVEVAAAAGSDTLTVVLNSNDKMQFDKKEIRVQEGKTVRLILKHTGSMPVTAMGHNFVLLNQGVSVSDFAGKAVDAKETDYIPQSELGNIIAYTNLLGGGQRDTIHFESPGKGSYDFLCSFPGHYAIMKGKFIVE